LSVLRLSKVLPIGGFVELKALADKGELDAKLAD
jgi:hypothetical protein